MPRQGQLGTTPREQRSTKKHTAESEPGENDNRARDFHATLKHLMRLDQRCGETISVSLANLAPHFRQTAFYARQLVSGLSGLAVPFLEARGASRGNVVRFPVKSRVFPQLAVRASRQRRWGGHIDNGDASSGAERIRPDFTACWLVR